MGGADALTFLDRRGVLAPRPHRRRFPVAVVRRRPRLALLLGLGGGPRVRYRVELLDRQGQALDRVDAESQEEADLVARGWEFSSAVEVAPEPREPG